MTSNSACAACLISCFQYGLFIAALILSGSILSAKEPFKVYDSEKKAKEASANVHRLTCQFCNWTHAGREGPFVYRDDHVVECFVCSPEEEEEEEELLLLLLLLLLLPGMLGTCVRC